MNKAVQLILYGIFFVWLFIYFLISFVVWEVDASQWHAGTRSLYVIVSFLLSMCWVGVVTDTGMGK